MFEKILVRTVWFSKKVFLSRKVFLSKKIILQASAMFRYTEDRFFFCMPHFVVEMFAGLKMFRSVARV